MQTQSDVRVTVRVDQGLKESAENLFNRLGLNMSTAFNIFLRKAVAEDAIPFPVSAKGSVFANGLTASEITGAFESAARNEIAENQREGFPVARYDAASRRAYLEFTDGTREYANG